MPQAPQPQDDAEVARLAREAIAIAFGTPTTAAQPKAQPKPVAKPTAEDEAAALAKQAIAIWRGTAA